jgi:ketosteroid isomerase-like protein
MAREVNRFTNLLEANMQTNRILVAVVLGALLAGSTAVPAEPEKVDLRQQVEAVERAFAKTMADRDHEAFTSFLSEEAIFLSGPMALRGKRAVATAWDAFFQAPEAPFSWGPTTVEVLDSGSLALSTGPVRDAEGRLISTFTSVWRQEAPGVWRIVLDQGNKACPEQRPSRDVDAD